MRRAVGNVPAVQWRKVGVHWVPAKRVAMWETTVTTSVVTKAVQRARAAQPGLPPAVSLPLVLAPSPAPCTARHAP